MTDARTNEAREAYESGDSDNIALVGLESEAWTACYEQGLRNPSEDQVDDELRKLLYPK